MALTAIAVVSTRREVLMRSPIQDGKVGLAKVREDERDGALRGKAGAGADRTRRVERNRDAAVSRELVVLHRAAEADRVVIAGAGALLDELTGHGATAGVLDRNGDVLLARLRRLCLVGGTDERAGTGRGEAVVAAGVELDGATAGVLQRDGARVLDRLLDLLGRGLRAQRGAEDHDADQRSADQARAGSLVPEHGSSPKVRLGSNDSTPFG